MARLNRFFKRPAPPEVRSDHEIVVFAHAADQRLKVKKFSAETHTIAYLDDLTDGGAGEIEWLDVGGDLPPIEALKFEVYPQVGDWLHIETHSPLGPAPTGGLKGIWIHDTSPFDASYPSEILIDCDNGPIALYSDQLLFGPNIMSVSSGGFTYQGGSFGIGLTAFGPPGRLQIVEPGGNALAIFTAESAHNANDGKFEIWRDDGVFPLTPIFRVTQNGTYQIKAGATWDAVL